MPSPGPRVLLILSESPDARSSGGSVAGYDRAAMLAGFSDLAIAYVDWDDRGEFSLDLGRAVPCWPISPSRRPAGLAFGWRVRRRLHAHLGALTHLGPWFFGLFDRAGVAAQVARYLHQHQPAVVCFDNMPSTLAWQACQQQRRLYFAHNVESDIVQYTFSRGWLKAVGRQRMRVHERMVLQQAHRVVCFTERDRRALAAIAPQHRIEVVAPAFAPPTDANAVRAYPPYVILPTNAIWEPNRLSLDWFAREVLSLVRRDVQFVITGADQDGFLAGMARRFDNLRYAGLVPRADYEALFRGAALFVNPTRFGSGFQVKLMEAVRHGVPVVSTAFSNQLGAHICSTDDGTEMAAMIERLYFSANALATVNYRSLWSSAGNQMRRLVSDASSLIAADAQG